MWAIAEKQDYKENFTVERSDLSAFLWYLQYVPEHKA